MTAPPDPTPGITQTFATHIVDQRSVPLTETVRGDAILHVIDTVAAMVSAALLPGGRSILQFADRWLTDGTGRSLVVGADLAGDAVSVARINGMLAHADETDDSHQASLTHPGCAVVPAALAVAHEVGASGAAFLQAVTIGYEVTARINLALGPEFRVRSGSKPSSHAMGGTFGAAAAAATLLGASVEQTTEILGYAAQVASGINTYLRDRKHVLKSFVFGGMPASNGVLAARMVMSGLPGMPDAFDDAPNFLDVHTGAAQAGWLTGAWGPTFVVSQTNIKRYPVGSPAQAIVQCAEALGARGTDPRRIASIRLRLPQDAAHIVSHRKSPNLDARYLAAVCLAEGRLSFARAHDLAAPGREPFASLIGRTEVIADADLNGARGGGVELALDDGTELRELTRAALGTKGAPLPVETALEKARFLFTETYDQEFADDLMAALQNLDGAPDLSTVGTLLARPRR